jgi:hypothetical protein
VQAHYDARRNRLLAGIYERSPALARIDAIRAAPKGTTIILGSDSRQPSLLVGSRGDQAAAGGGTAGAAAGR